MTRWEWEGYLQGDSEYGVTLWPEPPVHPLALAMQRKWGGRDEMPKTEKLADALEGRDREQEALPDNRGRGRFLKPARRRGAL